MKEQNIKVKNVCVITGSRAEYGLLKNILFRIKDSKILNLQLIVTGMHTSEKYGNTYLEIINDGFNIDYLIRMQLESDTPENIIKECGNELIQFSHAFSNLKPDLMVILGDRYEIFVAAFCSLIFRIPIAHICGGDITKYAYDDNLRHAISKLSSLHFVTHESSKIRLMQMGEDKKNIFNFGNPGLEDLYNFKSLSKKNLEDKMNIKFKKYNFLIIYHPTTLLGNENYEILQLVTLITELLEEGNHSLFIILPNSDNNNNIIFSHFQNIEVSYKNCYLFKSLERNIYLSMALQMDLYIGNSSSGIYELPILKIPVINIGRRQEGRLKANNIIDCPVEYSEIKNKIEMALKINKNDIQPIYQGYNSSKKIVKKIGEKIDNIKIYKNFINI